MQYGSDDILSHDFSRIERSATSTRMFEFKNSVIDVGKLEPEMSVMLHCLLAFVFASC